MARFPEGLASSRRRAGEEPAGSAAPNSGPSVLLVGDGPGSFVLWLCGNTRLPAGLERSVLFGFRRSSIIVVVATRILVIEDDADLRSLLRMILEDEDFDVVDAEDGMSGVAKADDSVDLVRLDIELPDMAGYALAHERFGIGCPARLTGALDFAGYLHQLVITAGDTECLRAGVPDGCCTGRFQGGRANTRADAARAESSRTPGARPRVESAVFRVWEVESAAGLPRRSLVAVRGYPATVLERPGGVHQVPRHECGVAVGEVVVGSA
jgi:hypothetical protein